MPLSLSLHPLNPSPRLQSLLISPHLHRLLSLILNLLIHLPPPRWGFPPLRHS